MAKFIENPVSIEGLDYSTIDMYDQMNRKQGNINNYENFNINEVEAMAKNNQLDMLFTRDPSSPTSHNIYVKYLLNKTTNRGSAIKDLVEEQCISQYKNE